MRIKGIVWAGTKTVKYDETVAFFVDTLELKIHETSPDLTVFRLPNGDIFEVIGPKLSPEMDVLTGPKVDFLVENVDCAVAELENKGCKLQGKIYRSDTQNWANFLAPDGNMYGITDLSSHPLHHDLPDRIQFYGPHEPYGFLSNWFASSIFLKGKIWPSVEHYYQAQKMNGTEYEELCRRLRSPREAYEMSRRPDIPIRSDWDQVKDDVMYEAVFAKFIQNPDLGEQLMATVDSDLIEASPIDNYWGIGRDGNGKNMLGKILMSVREKLISKNGL